MERKGNEESVGHGRGAGRGGGGRRLAHRKVPTELAVLFDSHLAPPVAHTVDHRARSRVFQALPTVHPKLNERSTPERVRLSENLPSTCQDKYPYYPAIRNDDLAPLATVLPARCTCMPRSWFNPQRWQTVTGFLLTRPDPLPTILLEERITG